MSRANPRCPLREWQRFSGTYMEQDQHRGNRGEAWGQGSYTPEWLDFVTG